LKAAIDDDGQMLPRSLSPTPSTTKSKKKKGKKANRKQLKAATAADI